MSRHLALETLSALLDSELVGAEAGTAQAHLVECGECRERLEGLRMTVSKLHSLPPASPPPPHVREALRRHLAVEQEVRRRLWTLPGWHARLAAWPAMAAAVFLAFGCGLFLYAYLVRQSVPRPAAEPAAPEADWRATITYERPAAEPADFAAAEDEGAAAGQGEARGEGKLEPQRQASRFAAAAPAAPPPPAAAAPQERPQALAKTAGAERQEPELGDVQRDAARVDETPAAAQADAEAAPAPLSSRMSAPAAPEAAAPSAPARADEPALRVGPGIEPPVKLSGDNPDFRALRGLRSRAGLVIVEGTIGRDGLLRDLSFRPPDLDPRLTELLRRALTTWRFEPARKDGRPVAVQYSLTVNIDAQ